MKKTLVYVLILCVLMLGGGFAAYRGYKHVRQVRLLNQARTYIDRNNERKALLVLQRALRYNPKDIEACRLMARLTEISRSPAAMVWRSRVVELNPNSTDDRLAMAKTALTFRDFMSAADALDRMDEPEKKTAAFHNIAGMLAAATNQLVQAEAHFLEVARLEPKNTAAQLNVAVVRLQSTNTTVLSGARTLLKDLSSTSTNWLLRCQALRELLVDAMRHKQVDAALAFSKQLLADTNSVFRDRILRLEVLQETRNPEFNSTLAAYQREAASSTNALKIYELATWQMAKMSPGETLTWMKTFPLSTKTNQPTALLIASCQALVQDWEALRITLKDQNWGELEFLRHAFNSRALRGLNLASGAKGEWELALRVANGQKENLSMLLRFVAQWNWQTESEDILWSIVDKFPSERWAVKALTQALYAGGRTRPLMNLFSQELKRFPTRVDIMNNVALLALLLEAKELKPHDLARQVYEKEPANAAYASTYAFSLFNQQKKAEALQVMQKLTPKDLENSGIAGYYGLILKGNGDRAKARPYLDSALKGFTLPEERRLFEAARDGA